MKGKRCQEKGGSLIELALIAPLLFGMFFSIVDFGLAFLVREQVCLAVWRSARDASISQSFSQSDMSALQTSLRAELDRVLQGESFVEQISAPFDDPNDQVGDSVVRVTATGNYRYFFLRLFGLSGKQMQIAYTMRYEIQPLQPPV